MCVCLFWGDDWGANLADKYGIQDGRLFVEGGMAGHMCSRDLMMFSLVEIRHGFRQFGNMAYFSF